MTRIVRQYRVAVKPGDRKIRTGASGRQNFAVWLQRESGPALRATDAQAVAGERLFLASGCGGCHTVRGTSANGTIGPDLTHVGGRLSLAAATLEQSEVALARWIVDNQHIKPENLMPPFAIFKPEELQALVAYLAALR